MTPEPVRTDDQVLTRLLGDRCRPEPHPDDAAVLVLCVADAAGVAAALDVLTGLGAKPLAGSPQELCLVDPGTGALQHVVVTTAGTAPRTPPPVRLARGGAVLAVTGGDGAGKTTAVQGLVTWLQPLLAARIVHLGKPPKSLLSLLVKVLLVVARRLRLTSALPHYPTPAEHGGRFPGYGWLLWQTTTARDRWRHLRRVQGWVAAGELVVCDRYPLEQLTLMDGPRTRWVPQEGLSRPARWLVDREQDYYARFGTPDLTVVLRVDPEVAVARKAGVDPPDYVRLRSREVFEADWSGSDVVVVDASAPADAVLDAVRGLVWQRL